MFVEAFLHAKVVLRERRMFWNGVTKEVATCSNTTRISRTSTIYAPNFSWIYAKFLTWTNVQINLEQEFLGTSYKLRTSSNIRSSTRPSWQHRLVRNVNVFKANPLWMNDFISQRDHVRVQCWNNLYWAFDVVRVCGLQPKRARWPLLF